MKKLDEKALEKAREEQRKKDEAWEIAQKQMEERERQNCIKLIGDKPYDFYPVMKAFERMKGIIDNTSHNIADYSVQERKKLEEQVEQYVFYMLSGKVLQITPDGVLVSSDYGLFSGYRGLIFATGWSQQDTAVDGDSFFAFGMSNGRYSYTSALGAMKTVTRFECARKPRIPIPSSKALPLPLPQ